MGAKSAIAGVVADNWNRIFVLHAWADKCPTSTLVQKIMDCCARYRPRIFGVEANAMQSLFVDMLMTEARRRGIRIPLCPIYQPPRMEKEFRIKSSLQPIIAHGKLFIQPQQLELRSQLDSFPNTMTVDLVDALASAVSMVPPASSGLRRSDEQSAYLEYLHASGAPRWYIEQQMAGIA